jgi:hypothetical protein
MFAFIAAVMIVLCFKVWLDPDIGTSLKLFFPVAMAAVWWRVRLRSD